MTCLAASAPALGLASLLVAAASLSAQTQTIVSPAGTATTEGSGAHAYPWLANNSNPISAVNVPRYMQIHSDLGSGPKVIQKLAFRRNGTSPTQAGNRAIDLELFMGNSVDFDKCSWVYAQNWLGTPTKVLNRQVINIGPLSAPGAPAPFELVIPITPYVHTGLTSLAWDAQIHSNTETPPMISLLDADASSAGLGTPVATTGPGCVPGGQNAAMSLGMLHNESGGIWTLTGWVDAAPKNAPLFLALGSTNPNLPVQGLCGSLYTDLLAVMMLGITDANGFFGVTSRTGATVTKGGGGPFAFAVKNTFGGQTIYAQAHALDAASTFPIGIANSNGRSALVPMPATTKIVRCTRLFHTDGLPNAPWAACQQTAPSAAKIEPSNVGYAIVTEFTY